MSRSIWLRKGVPLGSGLRRRTPIWTNASAPTRTYNYHLNTSTLTSAESRSNAPPVLFTSVAVTVFVAVTWPVRRTPW